MPKYHYRCYIKLKKMFEKCPLDNNKICSNAGYSKKKLCCGFNSGKTLYENVISHMDKCPRKNKKRKKKIK